MSKCGKCRNRSCSCFLIDDGKSTLVKGVGTSYSPYQVRPRFPATSRPALYVSSSAAQSITLNTNVLITFDRSLGSGAWVPGVYNRLTITTAGFYLIGGFAAIVGSAVSQTWDVWIAKNGVLGTPLVKRTTTASVGNASWPLHDSLMTAVRLSANDYLELYVRSNRTLNTAVTVGDLFAYPNLWANWMGV